MRLRVKGQLLNKEPSIKISLALEIFIDFLARDIVVVIFKQRHLFEWLFSTARVNLRNGFFVSSITLKNTSTSYPVSQAEITQLSARDIRGDKKGSWSVVRYASSTLTSVRQMVNYSLLFFNRMIYVLFKVCV